MDPTYGLEWVLFLCRNNVSEISSYLHSSGRIKQTAVAKCRANPHLCQTLDLCSGIQGSMSARAMRVLMASVLVLSLIDSCVRIWSQAIWCGRCAPPPIYSCGRLAAYEITATAAICELGFEDNGNDWVDRMILGLTTLGMHRNSGHRPPWCNRRGRARACRAAILLVRPATVAMPINLLAELLNLLGSLALTRGGRADNYPRRKRAMLPTGPADPMAMGGRTPKYTPHFRFNQKTESMLSERDSPVPVRPDVVSV